MRSVHDTAEIEAWFRERGIDLQQLRLLRNDFYKRRLPWEEAVRHVPAPVRGEFLAEFAFHTLALDARRDSRTDDASKLVFAAADGSRLEAVILRARSGRTTLCLSCQVGCAGSCTFCATGRMGFVRQLSAAEILDQITPADRIAAAEGRRIRNLVFMGMGEPFHNETNLDRALDVMLSPKCFDISPKRVMVSTIGVPDAMVRFAGRHPDVRLAVSLHSARQTLREELMPLARTHRLEQLREAVAEVARIQRQDVMIEYLLLQGLTDGDQDLAALRTFLTGLPVWVNLIAYNPVDGAPGLTGSSAEVRDRFAEELKASGLLVMTRRSLGRDIAAACGQLARKPAGQRPSG